MEWLRMMGLCILAAGMVMLLRQMHPQTASLLSVAFGAMVVLCVLPFAAQQVSTIAGFLESCNLHGEYSTVMLKTTGIVLVTQLAGEVCRELDAPAAARRAEFCGRAALLGVAVPVFISLTQMAMDMLG